MHFLFLTCFLAAFHVAHLTAENLEDDHADDDDHWSYHGPDGPQNWPGICVKGKKQSPVELGGKKKRLGGPPLKFSGSYRKPVAYTSEWNGHADASIYDDPTVLSILSGGSLGGVYYFHSLHWHLGGEHTIRKKRTSMELHIVHYNSKYDADDAFSKRDGIAVLGIFLQEKAKLKHSKVTDFIQQAVSNSTYQKKVKLIDLLPKHRSKWIRYKGSLTAPNCSENVVWTVFPYAIYVKKGLVRQLQKLHSSTTTYRPVQQLNGRTIYIHNPKRENDYDPDNDYYDLDLEVEEEEEEEEEEYNEEESNDIIDSSARTIQVGQIYGLALFLTVLRQLFPKVLNIVNCCL